MENTGWKGLGLTLWQRVVLSYKSTLLGLVCVAGSVVAENLLHSPNKTISLVGGVIGAALALYKSPTLAPPQ